jgi:glycosyltransferase involved in cell wall biosynthesis
MADKLAVLVDSPSLREKMGEQARQRVKEQYSILANVNRYHALYDQLLARS